ncbi:uroporphyrinogen-III synthase [Candidatus Magnetaquicoccus inordinatus]|uniref:uroporphyrinogen-III synthase n=1 Tax=Candidatus Magnetaquicoccus inordinatus TaxID=2496818 RepID=UPI00102B7341|nr:uroporphyrinogen-III synthase [Candidatus Magnetaquicoccus inordinatus]
MPTALHLQGRTLLITRPEPEAEQTARLVQECQGRALLAPALTIQPPADLRPLQQALQRCLTPPHPYRAIVLTSINAARAVIQHLPDHAQPPPFFAVGKQTATLLQEKGWPILLPPQASGGEALAHYIMHWAETHPDPCRTLLFPQAAIGREELPTLLSQAGWLVERVQAYRAEPITTLPLPVQQALAQEQVDAILFFSSRSFQAFVNALPAEGKAWLQRPLLAVISPVTGQSLLEAGLSVAVTAREATTLSMLEGLQNYWQQQKK